MKNIVSVQITLFCLFSTQNIQAQTSQRDSIEIVCILTKSSEFIKSEDYKNALNEAEIAYRKTKPTFNLAIGWANINRGYAKYYLGNIDKGLQLSIEGLSSSVLAKDSIRIGEGYMNIGDIMDNRGNFSAALDDFYLAKKIFELIKDTTQLLSSINNICHVNMRLSDYHSAIGGFKEYFKIRNKSEKYNDIIIAYNVALTSKNLGNIKSALNILKPYVRFYRITNNRSEMIRGYTLIGLCYEYMEQYDIAFEYYKISLFFVDTNNVVLCQLYASSLNNIAHLYRSRKDNGTALKYYQMAIKFGERNGVSVPDRSLIKNNIAELYLGVDSSDRPNKKETIFAATNLQEAKQLLGYKTLTDSNNKKIDKFVLAHVLSNLGKYYLIVGDTNTALINFEQSYNIFFFNGYLTQSNSPLLNIGNIHLNRNEFEKAYHCYNGAYELAKKLNSKNELLKATKQLSKYYAIKKDFAQAYYFEHFHSILYEEFNNFKYREALISFRIFENAKVLLMNYLKEVEISHQKKTLRDIGFGSIIVLLSSFFFIKTKKKDLNKLTLQSKILFGLLITSFICCIDCTLHLALTLWTHNLFCLIIFVSISNYLVILKIHQYLLKKYGLEPEEIKI